jgi:lipopolysaccharide export system protein LptC
MAEPETSAPDDSEVRLQLRRPGGTRMWRTAKLVLPTVATLAILLLIFWSQSNLQESRFRIDVTELAPEDIENMKMVNLRFDGMDKQNRPFSITADTASQNKDIEGVIDLIEPRADITMEDGAWVAMTAGAGQYDRDGDGLELGGGVNVFHDKGFEMSTEQVDVDLANGTTSSSTATTGQGPAGFLNAAGFRLENDGDRVFLTGPAQLNLYAAAEQESDDGPDAPEASPEVPVEDIFVPAAKPDPSGGEPATE